MLTITRKRICIVIALGFPLAINVLTAAAQGTSAEYPHVEMFAGLSYLSAESVARNNFFGGQGEFTLNFHRNLGITVDAGGQYRSAGTATPLIHAYELFAGPRFAARTGRTTLFTHALVGVVHGLARGRFENFLAGAFGGGVDVSVSDHFAVRLLQGDFIPNRSPDRTFKDARFGTGIVLNLR